MKHILFAVLALLTFTGCKKDDDEASTGMLSVSINGKAWTGKLYTYNEQRFSILTQKLKSVSGVEVPWEILSISLLVRTLDRQTVYKTDTLLNTHPDIAKTYASFSTAQVDGDVLCDAFEVIDTDSANNWLQITEERNNYSEIRGRFSLSFRKIDSCASSPYPDTLHFRNGEFHVFLK